MKARFGKGAQLAATILIASAAVFLMSWGSPQSGDIKRGEYLVKGAGCGDCHTPMKMGQAGPEPDNSRTLSGHPQGLIITAAPQGAGEPWMGVFSATFTAWAGPWGVSFTANLTPDKDTGLGAWTSRTFIDTIRSGRVMAKGRQIMPPMPFPAFQHLTDEDLASIFAYLQTLLKIVNKVPEPIPPKAGN